MKATELREMTDAVKKDIARVMTIMAEKNVKNA